MSTLAHGREQQFTPDCNAYEDVYLTHLNFNSSRKTTHQKRTRHPFSVRPPLAARWRRLEVGRDVEKP